MGRAERALRERFGHGPLKLVDAKPLPVGGYSKDRDARSGYATGTLARGYKLHVLRDARCPAVPDHWVVASMNHKEVAVAPDLLDQRAAALAMALAGAAVAWVSLFGYLAGDNGYDSNRLYDLARRSTCSWSRRRGAAPRVWARSATAHTGCAGWSWRGPRTRSTRWVGRAWPRASGGACCASGTRSSARSGRGATGAAGWVRCRTGCAGRGAWRCGSRASCCATACGRP